MKNLIVLLLTAVSLTGAQAIEPVEITEEPKEETKRLEKQYLTGREFTESERIVLKFFQDEGITDPMALAVILGNIKQESMFYPNICEGGSRVSYTSCRSGGYGLIQWTTDSRYLGLGNHANKTGGDASSLRTQLEYLVTEREWKLALRWFSSPDKSMGFYMDGAYTWLGWGVEGNRSYYSQDYYNRLG
jgi:hypothetical protein